MLSKTKRLQAYVLAALYSVLTVFNACTTAQASENTSGGGNNSLSSVATVAPNSQVTDSLHFTKLEVLEYPSNTKVADLLQGETPALKANTTYSLKVAYKIPQDQQFKDTYLKLYFGDGLYIKTLPGATFKEGKIDSTGFEELVKTPTGTETSPYNYPSKDSEKAKNGELIYKTKTTLLDIENNDICFALDEAYLNESTEQLLTGLIKCALTTSKDETAQLYDPKSYDVKSAEAYTYGFWNEQATEVVSKGGTTSTLQSSITGGKALTRANSKTIVELVYPSDIELVGLEETALYKKNGTIKETREEGDTKITTFEWEEAGSYSGGATFKPYLKVPKDSKRANGSSFTITLQNFKKTVYEDSPELGRTSKDKKTTLTVQIIDGDKPEKITTHALVDKAANWAWKKYTSYNARIGMLLFKNDLAIPTQTAKTLELTIDEGDVAIVRGVTIPYHKDMQYGQISWTSANGKKGTVDAKTVLKINQKGVGALLTNTALGLEQDESIKSIKVDLGKIPASYNGIKPYEDILETWDANNKYVYDEAYYWSYAPCAIFGTWKQGQNADIKTTAKLYVTGQTAKPEETYTLIGRSANPKILNGVGSIDKTQVNGGESFNISGKINDANWDWNSMQEPVLYMFMPEGFSYTNLNVTNANLANAEFVGTYTFADGRSLNVWKHELDIGQETRGQYQPDFTTKSMEITCTIKTDKRAKVQTYHINDFIGITTKDFVDIGAEVKAEHWDKANWLVSKYFQTKEHTAVVDDKVNGGKSLVSLAESNGVAIKQAYEVTAQAEQFLTKTGKVYLYDASSDETKQKTTPVLNNGETTVMHIGVRNNTEHSIDHVTLFVPLMQDKVDLGKAFMPEGKLSLPLTCTDVKTSDNFTVKYLKLKMGKSFKLNTAPQPDDYEEVSDIKDAHILQITAKQALGQGDGGKIDIAYKAENLTKQYNNMKSVITPVLDYDIDGNKSTLTKEPAAVSFFTDTDPVLPKPEPEPTQPEPTQPEPTKPEPTSGPTIPTESEPILIVEYVPSSSESIYSPKFGVVAKTGEMSTSVSSLGLVTLLAVSVYLAKKH